MQITVWISSISFHAYADIVFESKTDVSTFVLHHLFLSVSLSLSLWLIELILLIVEREAKGSPIWNQLLR